MDDLQRSIREALSPEQIQRLGLRLEESETSTQRAVEEALPMILKQLGRNASRGGAEPLANALDRDHDGSILDQLSGHIDGGSTEQGNAILGHIFGNKRGKAEQQVSQASGLSMKGSGQLMAILAPILMGVLGKQRRKGGLGTGDLGRVLTGAGGGRLGCLAAALPMLLKLLGKRR